MPGKHEHSTEDAPAPRSTEAAGAARLRALEGGSAPQAKAPLITAVKIENFKGIGRSIRVDLRPITLLFGRNSAGKSTILHALCYAHEILSGRNVDAGKVELGGDQIDLGGFRTFVHAHDLEHTTRLCFGLNMENWREIPPHGARYKGPTGPLGDKLDTFGSGAVPADFRFRSGWVELAVTWNRVDERPVLASYEVGVNESLVGRIRPDATADNRLDLNWAHPAFGRFRTADQAPTYAGAAKAREAPDPNADDWRLLSVRVHGRTSPFPDWNELLDLNVDDLKRHDEVVIDDMSDFEDFRDLVSELLVGIGQALRNELADLRYVGPVRKLRPPTSVEPGSLDRGSWSDGSAAWNRLLPAPSDPSRPDLLKDVNDWLASKDRLDTGYRLTRKSTVELPAEAPPVNWIRFRERLSAEYRNEHGAVDLDRWAKKLAETVASLHHGDPGDIETRIKADPGNSGDRDESANESPTEQHSPEEKLVDAVRERYQFLANLDSLEKGHHPSAVRNLVGAIAAAPMLTKLELVTAGSELPVRTSDIGVGISQILPVVAAALDPHRPGITAIEQPELHLHPKLQVELGDLFAEPANDGRIFLLENHSEHLMLRLLRRIEETHSGELPEGKPALKPDQVSVVFLEQVDGEVQATRLRVDETGEFIDRWPQGFFDERDDELF